MPDSFSLIETEEKMTAVITLAIVRTEIEKVMNAAIAEVLSTLSAQNIAPSGPVSYTHLTLPTNREV